MNTLARNAAFDRRFRVEIGRLKASIETVPADYRAKLHSAADKAQEQHERLQAASRTIDDMVADIGLMVEHTEFDMEVCRRELASSRSHRTLHALNRPVRCRRASVTAPTTYRCGGYYADRR